MRRQPYALKNLKNDVLTEKNIIFVRPHVQLIIQIRNIYWKKIKKRIFKNELIKKLMLSNVWNKRFYIL